MVRDIVAVERSFVEIMNSLNLKSPRCRVTATNDFSILAFPNDLFLVRQNYQQKFMLFHFHIITIASRSNFHSHPN